MRRSRRRRSLALLLGLLELVAASLVHVPSAAATTSLRIAAPAYSWSAATWSRLAATAEVDLVVANPASGPGTAGDTAFDALVATAVAAGKRVIGYIHTDYARRPLADVVRDITRYRAWYGINGFFLDEVPWGCGDATTLTYYASVAAAVRTQPSPFVVLNPGGVQQGDCYMASADLMVDFEGTAAAYAGWQPSAWTDAYPPGRFWHIVYGAADLARDEAVLAARTRNVGHLYVTPSSQPNPFAELPPVAYWNALVQVVSGGSPVSGAVPVTSSPAATTRPVPPPGAPLPVAGLDFGAPGQTGRPDEVGRTVGAVVATVPRRVPRPGRARTRVVRSARVTTTSARRAAPVRTPTTTGRTTKR